MKRATKQRLTDMNTNQQGIALLGAMMLVLLVSLLGAMLLSLAGEEAVSAAAGRDAALAQQLGDSAAELVLSWLNNPRTVPPSLAAALAKRNATAGGAPSFFDGAGRSQFKGTADRPDVLVDDRVLNDPRAGVFHAMRDLGVIEELKMYAPSRPGLLCTVAATVATQNRSVFRQSIIMQLAALDVPALRAAVQVGQNLGAFESGKESPVGVHWGVLKVSGEAVFLRADEIPALSAVAPVTGQGYDETLQREDRWMEAWIGGQAQVTQPAVPGPAPAMPQNVHVQQRPIPGIRLDEWPYEQLKRVAKQFGRYFAIDRAGLLYPQGVVQLGQGISSDEVLRSQAVGDQLGLIFIDTLDQQAPRPDNLGTVTIRAGYVEGLVVVQGHVQLAPSGGQSLAALSPPLDGHQPGSRASVQLSGVNLNGVLYAGGTISVTGRARIFGAVTAGGTIAPSSAGSTLEIWYNQDLGEGLYKGLPVVYRAPGTWLAKY